MDHTPTVFTPESGEAFLKAHKSVELLDVFERQLKELYFIENGEFIGSDKEAVYSSAHFEEYKNRKKNEFVYIYYPWLNRCVKSVTSDPYFELITNRNRDLVTPEEQKRLYDEKIAVFGLSVGSNIAYTLVQSGISREITIADYDELDTTNLNRLPAGLPLVGVNKSVIAARRMYENNPFLTVHVLDHGISIEGLSEMLEAKKITMIFEEIDNIGLKMEIRKIAKKYKVPVLMITDNADGVILHIERYDLGYDQFFGKPEQYWNEKLSNIKSLSDIGALILEDIIGGEEHVHPRVTKSVEKVLNRELISWSQLGTAALLGGVVGTVAVKHIISHNDTRKYVHERIDIKL